MTTILITGAGSGLNRGAAFELAGRGDDVIAGVEIYPRLRALEIECRERGVRPRIEKIDGTREGDRRRARSWERETLAGPSRARRRPPAGFPSLQGGFRGG